MRYLLLLVSMLLPATLFAEKVTPERAQAVAADFLSGHGATRTTPPRLELVWDGETAQTRTAESDPALYVFNRTDARGFVIVAGDDAVQPVLGYSLENPFPGEGLPDNLRNWIQGLRGQILDARSRGLAPTEGVRAAWGEPKTASTGTVVTQLSTAKWDQYSPYNDLCPMVGTERAVSGCVPTAMAIIMRYHRWPDKGQGTLPSYQYERNGRTISVEGHALGHVYDWDQMPLTYSSASTAEQKRQVARLVYDCGIMSQAMYNTASSGGTGAYTDGAVAAMLQYMKYDKGAQLLQRAWYSDTEWIRMLKAEIDNNGPVFYSGANVKQEGHQFVLDGYTSDNYFGVNWGWSGQSDGYYLLSALEPGSTGAGGGSGDGFILGQDALFSVKKDPDGTSSYADLLVLGAGESDGTHYVGLKADTGRFIQGQSFSCYAAFIYNLGFTAFNGSFAVALSDRKGNFKENVSQEMTISNLQEGYGTGRTNIQCRITQTIAPGDRLRVRYKSSSGGEWKWMPGYDEQTVWEIVVMDDSAEPEPVERIEEHTSLSYNRTTQQLTLKTLAGVRCVITSPTGAVVFDRVTGSDGVLLIPTESLRAGSHRMTLSNDDDRKEITFTAKR